MPPVKLARSVKPFCCKMEMAWAERLPARQQRRSAVAAQFAGASSSSPTNQNRAAIWPSAREFAGFAHIEDLHFRRMLFEPCGSISHTPAKL